MPASPPYPPLEEGRRPPQRRIRSSHKERRSKSVGQEDYKEEALLVQSRRGQEGLTHTAVVRPDLPTPLTGPSCINLQGNKKLWRLVFSRTTLPSCASPRRGVPASSAAICFVRVCCCD
ncbi:hypothetical protein MRX96_009477 [Rhipicephalus microplus]